jgi:hypothetical protein
MEMRGQFLSITAEQWVLLILGLVAGGFLWILFNRRVVYRLLCHLNSRSYHINVVAAVESVIGGIVFLLNAGLVYLSTIVASFFLFAFSIAGLLVGAWITMPASFE